MGALVSCVQQADATESCPPSAEHEGLGSGEQPRQISIQQEPFMLPLQPAPRQEAYLDGMSIPNPALGSSISVSSFVHMGPCPGTSQPDIPTAPSGRIAEAYHVTRLPSHAKRPASASSSGSYMPAHLLTLAAFGSHAGTAPEHGDGDINSMTLSLPLTASTTPATSSLHNQYYNRSTGYVHSLTPSQHGLIAQCAVSPRQVDLSPGMAPYVMVAPHTHSMPHSPPSTLSQTTCGSERVSYGQGPLSSTHDAYSSHMHAHLQPDWSSGSMLLKSCSAAERPLHTTHCNGGGNAHGASPAANIRHRAVGTMSLGAEELGVRHGIQKMPSHGCTNRTAQLHMHTASAMPADILLGGRQQQAQVVRPVGTLSASAVERRRSHDSTQSLAMRHPRTAAILGYVNARKESQGAMQSSSSTKHSGGPQRRASSLDVATYHSTPLSPVNSRRASASSIANNYMQPRAPMSGSLPLRVPYHGALPPLLQHAPGAQQPGLWGTVSSSSDSAVQAGHESQDAPSGSQNHGQFQLMQAHMYEPSPGIAQSYGHKLVTWGAGQALHTCISYAGQPRSASGHSYEAVAVSGAGLVDASALSPAVSSMSRMRRSHGISASLVQVEEVATEGDISYEDLGRHAATGWLESSMSGRARSSGAGAAGAATPCG